MQTIGSWRIPSLMGILNITEDSFSDGGKYLDPRKALEQAEKLIQDGADIIDIGGESTRPGSTGVDASIEKERVLNVLTLIKSRFPEIMISVDTRKSDVASKAIGAGAEFINDVSSLSFDPGMASVLAKNPHVKLILMHMQGTPETMQDSPFYADVVGDITSYLMQKVAFAESAGIQRDRLYLDPGIGFGKDLSHNLTILSHLDEFRELGFPLVIGASRKRFINLLDPSHTDERLGGSLAAALVSALQGVEIIRVHDIKAHRQFFQVLQAISEF
jgi:dihydropteroate synthase